MIDIIIVGYCMRDTFDQPKARTNHEYLYRALIISLAQKLSRDLGFYGFAAPTLTRNLTYFLRCSCHVIK